MTFKLAPYLKENQDIVNEHLVCILDQFDSRRELIKAMNHSLMAGGKRVRPVLAMAAAQACGSNPQIALPAACAIEMIHTYSLIHDDLPGMDDDDLRRGQPTCHKQFSEAVAILAGDALLTHAFNVIASPESVFKLFPDPEIRLNLVQILSSSSGLNGMVEGQMLDMLSYDGLNDDRLAHLKKIHALKTGKMIIASTQAGAVSAGAGQGQIDQLMTYADKIGLAFQVVDDILNVEGNPEIMGKAAGSDSLHDKMTFPAIIGLEPSRDYAKELVNEAKDSLSSFDEKAAPLLSIADYIINRDH